jgi:hypothetical protein
MIVDFHTHIFPVEICRDRQCYFPDEPAFRLLYDQPKARLVTADALIAAMDQDGVSRSVVFGFPWRHPDLARRNNDAVLEAVARHPRRLTGFCCLDVSTPGAATEVDRCLRAGLSGVGELAFYTGGIDTAALEQLGPIMELARHFDVPLLLHANEPVGHVYPGKAPMTLRQLYDLVRRFPENRIVLAHWGGGLLFYGLLRKEVKAALANVWFDTAASPFLYDPEIYAVAVRIVGAERILFGSDFPLLPPRRGVRDIAAAGLPPEAQRRILGENAMTLLGV